MRTIFTLAVFAADYASSLILILKMVFQNAKLVKITPQIRSTIGFMRCGKIFNNPPLSLSRKINSKFQLDYFQVLLSLQITLRLISKFPDAPSAKYYSNVVRLQWSYSHVRTPRQLHTGRQVQIVKNTSNGLNLKQFQYSMQF